MNTASVLLAIICFVIDANYLLDIVIPIVIAGSVSNMSADEAKSLTTVTQAITQADFKETQTNLLKFVKSILKEAKNIKDGDTGDYGIIPFTKKKQLLKPGAEKLAKFFGLVPSYIKLSEVEDWDKGFTFYKYKCVLTHFATGKHAGESIRSANSKEKQVLAQGKTVFETANMVEAKAQKRALVAAVVQATMASEIFDADVPGDYDNSAPNKTTTREEDPRRSRLSMRLYATAGEHGWTDAWIHKAIEKKWHVDSVTKISNDQMEELTEFIVKTYMPVGKGNAPTLRDPKPIGSKSEESEPVQTEQSADEPIKGEVIPDEKYFCRGEKHQGEGKEQAQTSFEDPWCSQECKDSYYPPKTKNTLEALIAKGKKKALDEASQTAEGSLQA